ncbi:MAG: hypothetical protein M5U34_32615 [Chloroflexi bacterium]|nr:hypothetical protein [Chloroflexota bacterium]
MLFTTLILPMVTPLIVRILGWDPTDYAIPQCVVPGQESMSRLQVALARMFDSGCWANILQSDFLYTLIIFIVVLLISIAVGLWWHSRKWAISAAIFYAIFLFLYTSVFSNIVNGIPSGMFGSLGYWLEQQGVQRGSQPTFLLPGGHAYLRILAGHFLAGSHLVVEQKRAAAPDFGLLGNNRAAGILLLQPGQMALCPLLPAPVDELLGKKRPFSVYRVTSSWA